jgi:hypothetical protein
LSSLLWEWLPAANLSRQPTFAESFGGHEMPLPQKICLLRKANSRMGILDTWNQYREAKKNQRQKKSDLIDLIERMVQDSDPSIRKVAGYRKQLQKPVENALGHMEGLISSIPGPFGPSAESWDKDPLMHALFVSPDEIRSLLQSCAELKSFFQQSGAKTAVALLRRRKKNERFSGRPRRAKSFAATSRKWPSNSTTTGSWRRWRPKRRTGGN